MTVQTQERVQASNNAWAAEDDIDLRKYLDILIGWWREIVLITLMTVVLATVTILILRFVLPAQYEASADVAIVRTVSDVNFDERFRTNPETLGTDFTSLSARRSALLGLVATGSIAQEVINQLGNSLSPTEQNPANLLDMVSAELASVGTIGSDSDLIRITVSADDAEKAAAIANAWARIYVREVNTIYGQVPNEVMTSIQTELAAAEKQYLSSQANLEAFTADNRMDELTGLVTILQQRIEQEVSLQKAYLLQWEDTQEQLATAQALHTQVQQGGEGAARSNMAALQILKMSVYGMVPEGLQVEVRELPDVNQQAMLADLDGLLQSLTQRLSDLESKIAAGGTPLGSTTTATSTLTIALENLRLHKAQLEAEAAKQLQLTQQRDLDWDTYKTLSSKVAELSLTRAAASSEVRFGAPAVAPINKVQRVNSILGVTLGGVFGFFLAIFYVSLAYYLGKTPFLAGSKHKTS